MKEIYLCFTPYHILLNCSIASTRNEKTEKDIIIVENFSNVEKIVKGLKDWDKNPFNEHLVIEGKFSVDEIPKKSVFNIFRGSSVVNTFKKGVVTLRKKYEKEPLDIVFTCNDERPQSQLLEYICKRNGGLNVYVEDGSELYNDSFEEPLPFHESVFYKMYYGRWYEKIRLIGDYRYTNEIRALRPDLVRDELKHKKIKPIDLKSFVGLKDKGLTRSLIDKFDVKIDMDGSYVLLFLPHSSFIKERGHESIYSKTVEELIKNNKDILLKYHPREKDYYLKEYENNVSLLPQSLPSEIFILQMIDNPPVVIGDVSTCLLTSKFLDENIKVISLIDILGMESRNLKGVFKKLGVLMPSYRTELEEMLKDI